MTIAQVIGGLTVLYGPWLNRPCDRVELCNGSDGERDSVLRLAEDL